jgi:predicted glycoside hydrolase/deacetylase ChbG (UPF0249 family)
VSLHSRGSTLVDPDGYFWRTVLQFALRADVKDVQREIEAQMDAARRAGIRPTHITTDMGALLTRPDLTRLYLQVAETHWIPAVIPELTPSMIEILGEEGLSLAPETIEAINQYRLPKLDDVQFVPDCDSYEAKRDALCQRVRSLAPGLTQIIFQPADRTKALELVSPRWQQRVWEAQLLMDPEVHQFFEDEGILVTNWIEIMARFESDEGFPSPERRRRNAAIDTPHADDLKSGPEARGAASR